LPNIPKYIRTIKDQLYDKLESFTKLFQTKNKNGLIPYLCPFLSCTNNKPEVVSPTNSRELREMVANSLKYIIEISSDKEKSGELKSIISILKLSYNKTQLESIKKNIDELDNIRNSQGYYENYTLWMTMQSEIETAVTNSSTIFPLYITGCIFKGVTTKQKLDYKISNEKPDMQMKDPISPINETKINDAVKLMKGCMQTFQNANAIFALSKIFGGIKGEIKDGTKGEIKDLPSKKEYEKLDKDRKAEFVFVIDKQQSEYTVELFISC
jgi:hypothetical protein